MNYKNETCLVEWTEKLKKIMLHLMVHIVFMQQQNDTCMSLKGQN